MSKEFLDLDHVTKLVHDWDQVIKTFSNFVVLKLQKLIVIIFTIIIFNLKLIEKISRKLNSCTFYY